VKKQDILENQAKLVYLSLGSNLGNRITNLDKAKFLLNLNNIKIIKSSCYYESKSWPNNKFPKYINIVVEAYTKYKINSLFTIIKLIEKKLGRKKDLKNYPRTCDIDIIDYDSKVKSINLNNKKIVIPHPRLHQRNFVLIPLFEISKDWIHPKFKQKIGNLLLKIKNNELSSIKII
tara:strand:- start:1657 stop:2184 length:528 start_codon:yes stop_codon:yes gene_type:complete